MNNRNIIYSLIRLALSDVQGEFDGFEGVSAAQWNQVFNVLSMHGLAAFVFPVIERMPENVRPPKEVVLKFIFANMNG